MYVKPVLKVIDVANQLPVFAACNSYENDSNSCYA